METLYANIIIDISHEKVDRPFQYKIPDTLKGTVEVGMEVIIPFGKGNTRRSGYVMELTTVPYLEPERLKEIMEVSQTGITVESNAIKLAYWMKTKYGSTMIQALKTVLPVKQKIKGLEKKTITLRLEEEEAKRQIEVFSKKHQVARERLLVALLEEKSLPLAWITTKLNVTAKTVEQLEQQGILTITVKSHYRNPVTCTNREEVRNLLSDRQQTIVRSIAQDDRSKTNGVYLLHGITGSGKTEVYMELIAGMIKEGKQAIVLIPEIALTYQTLLRFFKRFGDRVSVMNSKLSQGERYDQMERAKKGEIDVVIGPRSALFTPFPNLGMIIIDEEHESTYKSETMPKYHARETAIQIASFYGAKVVLGSATPSLEAYYAAKRGKIALYELTERLTGGTLPTVYIEDLRTELKEGNRSIFSRRLQSLLQERLEQKQQSMLFLNRRGYAGFLSCRSCGHVMKCPHCDISLSEHKDGTLVCHYCGYREPTVTKCPECGSPYISGFRAGTQQIEEVIKKQFPQARVLRMDADTTKQKDSYEEILAAFANHEADILVGTQMIIKGHDFPNVTLMGILAADLSLASNDYRAGERTFQMLTQAAGRAGRGENPGEVVIQTYQPDHYSVVHAANQDYQAFYEEEVFYRELLHYPPKFHMMAMLITSKEEKEGLELANYLANYCRKKSEQSKGVVIGPAAATIGKISDIYRHIIYVKQEDWEQLVSLKDGVEDYMKQSKRKDELVQFDFDPMSAY